MNDLPKGRPKARNSVSSMAGNACTEDKIPVKTIHVGNISSEITAKEVKEYFLKFGTVTTVAIEKTGSERGPWIDAFVTFEESESAAKALDLATHEILSRRVVVNAAKSTWSEVSTDEASEMKCSLLDLDDDCLYHIASYLELRDLLNLSKTCKRLECGLEPAFASYKKLDMDSLCGLTLMEKREILYKIGPHLQHFGCSENFELIGRFEEFLENYCVAENIVSLNCRTCSLSKGFIEKLKNLKTLIGAITDDMIGVLSNCSNLQNLNLWCSRDFTGEHLDKLSNLQNLNLDRCEKLRPHFFKNLCMKTKLVSLNIKGCRLLGYSSIETLASTQTKLESLSISNDYWGPPTLSPLAKLKNLKRLQIDCCYKECNEFFQELAKQSGAELEVLEILGCRFNQKVEQAICSLKKLKVLAVKRCEKITSMFLTKLSITPLECLIIESFLSVLRKGVLNLISKSETIKVIAVETDYLFPQKRLVLSAYEVMKKKERKYPMSLFTSGPCIIDGIFYEKSKLDPQREFLKIIKKLEYLDRFPGFNFFIPLY